MPAFQAPVGTFDVLPPESSRYEALVARFAEHVGRAGYGSAITPMFEDVGVFERLGTSTDIVRKEMYDFEDKGGRHLALRPEGTASVVRAFVQRRPLLPFKVWYVAPVFRYERPQAGRYRQHHQLGIEALGSDDADLDAEVVFLAWSFYAALGLNRVRLRLTSLGDATCRPAYREELRAHLAARRDGLCEEHRQRIDDNPLRVLDCKREACREASAEAPRMLAHLCDECGRHFDRVTTGLAALGVAFQIDPSLVRGLDYYTRTTFEFTSDALEFAHSGAGGGGRYDGLVEALGGPPTPGIGFGLGIERILLTCDAEGAFPTPGLGLDVFVIDTTGGQEARDVTAELREAGLTADRAFDQRSWKSQMKSALRSEAALAVVLEAGEVSIRTLQEKGEAEAVERATLVEHVQKKLGELR
ncbi:MAG: histidine--tRNA ligase [Actinomycetota bacterium]|nr:histidine--tRNA ligase [Actinomycetota bacterium]MDQ3573702.1 histidine--tRNA ligase [Actinomycetota bacterium]